MNLTKMTNDEIIAELNRLVLSERRITNEILWHIAEVESRKIYAEKSCSSSTEYLIKRFGYSERAAYRRVQAARVLVQVPEVSQKLEEGCLNLTQLSQVQHCIRKDRKLGKKVAASRTREILATLENKTGYQTEKLLAVEFNQPVYVAEKLRPQKDDSFRLELTLTSAEKELLDEAKALVSHSCPSNSWKEAVLVWARAEVRRRKGSPSAKAVNKTVIVSGESSGKASQASSTTQSASVPPFAKARLARRKYISIKIRRAVFANANYACQYVDGHSGLKCCATGSLQIDHIVAVALGGTDKIENLRALCRTHNLLAARKAGIGIF